MCLVPLTAPPWRHLVIWLDKLLFRRAHILHFHCRMSIIIALVIAPEDSAMQISILWLHHTQGFPKADPLSAPPLTNPLAEWNHCQGNILKAALNVLHMNQSSTQVCPWWRCLLDAQIQREFLLRVAYSYLLLSVFEFAISCSVQQLLCQH